MYGIDTLHWSFSYARREQRELGEQLCAALGLYIASCEGAEPIRPPVVNTYKVLPNFWRGYNRATRSAPSPSDLAMGHLSIETRGGEAGRWRYIVSSRNGTNGENLHIDFSSRDDAARTILDRWTIRSENTSGDLYKSFDCRGRLRPVSGIGQEILLAVGGLEITAGLHRSDLPLTSNWALFDVIPALAKGHKNGPETVDIAILEDMKILREPCHIGFLGSIELELGKSSGAPPGLSGDPLRLSGYWVYGRGVLPTYWWVDQRGRVVSVSSTFQTLVLMGVQNGRKDT